MLGSLLFLLAQAAVPPSTARPSTARPSTTPDDIVVVGRRAEEQLAACLSRDCPPAEEIEASLQASVEQFAGGRYVDARHTLQKALRRQRGRAADMPGPVSTLYATLATVAQHEGDRTLWMSSARNNVLVLRRHLGEGHEATLTQELNFADNLVGLNAPALASAAYRSVQRTAVDIGRTDLAANAAFRQAWLSMLSGRDREAERLANEAAALVHGQKSFIPELRDILRARIAARRGDDAAVDRLAARLRQSAAGTPKLLSAPPIENINPAPGAVEQDRWHDSRIRFADVGFWIRPDGRTSGAEVLRTSGLGQWGPGILKHVGGRRYVPLDIEPTAPGIYRIDRFTVRATIGVPIGTRIAQRMGDLTVHIADLTETDAINTAYRERIRGKAPDSGQTGTP